MIESNRSIVSSDASKANVNSLLVRGIVICMVQVYSQAYSNKFQFDTFASANSIFVTLSGERERDFLSS